MEATIMKKIESAKSIAGPFVLFDKSFILEFLEPPASLKATVLMRCTYTGSLQNLGKQHPQSPPLHLHFDQDESFFCATGKVGTTDGWAAKDTIWTKENGIQTIGPWEPHRFWPVPDHREDATIYLWAHPENVPEPMDAAFFENLLRYLSDVFEKKESMSLLQMMAMNHASATALIMFPRAWFLGPLRWWAPWAFQGAISWVAGCCGYTALQEKYTQPGDWERFARMKKA